MQPLVSIHIATYQQRDLVIATLESALAQTYPHIELVVADDGSNDGTAEIIADYQRRYPDKIRARLGPHVGVQRNWNNALNACQGKYIAFLNGDDVFFADKIARQVEWMEASTERVLCGCDVVHFREDPSEPFQKQSDLAAPFSGQGPEKILKWGMPFATVSVMVRASAVPERGFDERLQACLDWKFWVDCLAHGGSFGYVDGVWGGYRVHRQNTTHTVSDRVWQDVFMGLGLVEAEHHHLARACRSARARKFYQRGIQALQSGEMQDAEHYLKISLNCDAGYSWKVYAALGLAKVQLNDAPEIKRRVHHWGRQWLRNGSQLLL